MFKYHPPIKEEIKESVPAKEETIIYDVDPVVPTAYIEKPPFPDRIKERAKVSTVVNKSYSRAHKPSEQIKVEPSVATTRKRPTNGAPNLAINGTLGVRH